ncbi:MAG: hypothetical protein IPO29_02340 [Anaerolineae bacterium]|nr:hypothetical protein [Anaerolineae bacterium]
MITLEVAPAGTIPESAPRLAHEPGPADGFVHPVAEQEVGALAARQAHRCGSRGFCGADLGRLLPRALDFCANASVVGSASTSRNAIRQTNAWTDGASGGRPD